MKEIFNNFARSGMDFGEDENLKARYQTLNIGLALTTIALIYGIIGNLIRGVEGIIPIELSIISMNGVLIILLRKYPKIFEYIVIVMISQFTLLFLFLIYASNPDSMKGSWIYTYPIILLYLQDTKKSFYWMSLIITLLVLAPIQNFIPVSYTLYQVTYISAVLIIINTIMYFYQMKMDEANNKITQQQNLLHNFNLMLEKQVIEKTTELTELNESLEIKVEEKLEELRSKDKILQVQSKQAVMGEMISMIAHQWRQPLSTITLQIANLQFKKLLGGESCEEEMDDALSDISDTIIYLSDTVDDFQTYFRTDKEFVETEIYTLLNKAKNFSISRTKERNIEIILNIDKELKIKTYINEFVQVILNILNNAIDALNDIDNEKPMITLNAKVINNTAMINISDNANGIKDENISKLFEPYFSTKGKNGTGLGLYMSQMIVQKQFNGEIKVQTSSKGSTFTIEVPTNTF